MDRRVEQITIEISTRFIAKLLFQGIVKRPRARIKLTPVSANKYEYKFTFSPYQIKKKKKNKTYLKLTLPLKISQIFKKENVLDFLNV